jgi:hypothetical protein
MIRFVNPFSCVRFPCLCLCATIKLDTIILTDYVTLFARIAATDQVMFVQLMDAAVATTAQNVAKPREATWEGLMDQWWNRVRVPERFDYRYVL